VPPSTLQHFFAVVISYTNISSSILLSIFHNHSNRLVLAVLQLLQRTVERNISVCQQLLVSYSSKC